MRKEQPIVRAPFAVRLTLLTDERVSKEGKGGQESHHVSETLHTSAVTGVSSWVRGEANDDFFLCGSLGGVAGCGIEVGV